MTRHSTRLALVVIGLLAGLPGPAPARAAAPAPALAPARAAAPALAPEVTAFGVLRPIGGLLGCLVLETDDGELFALDDLGGLVEGDRVFAAGDRGGIQLCGSLLLPRLVGNVITPAFAGLGRTERQLSGALVLVADGGGTYALPERTGLPAGLHVFVKGRVVAAAPDAGGPALLIEDPIVGHGRAAYGRLEPAHAGGWALRTAAGGLLLLERQGIAFGAPGDFAYVEGWVDFAASAPLRADAPSGARPSALAGPAGPSGAPSPTTAPTSPDLPPLASEPPVLLRDNTTRPAFEAAGVLVPAAGGGLALKADGKLFDDEYPLADTGGFVAGNRVFVRGRRANDFDPLEPQDAVREARLDAELTAFGTLVPGADPPVLLTLGGDTIELEFKGALVPGQLVYVAGALDPGAPLLRFLHDIALPAAELMGTLQHGFECTPLFVSSQVHMLENLDGHQVGEEFCALGGIAACEADCPVPCLVANITHDCTM